MADTGARLTGAHVYEHLGVRSRRLGETSGETTMPVNDEIRTAGGVRAAPLGLAFEQGVATYAFDTVLAVPTQISLHLRDRCEGVQAVRSRTQVVRLGRAALVTDGGIRDAADPGRLVAFGTITWAVTGPAPAGPTGSGAAAEEPPAYAPRGLDVLDAVGVRPGPDGEGVQVTGLGPQLAGPGGVLHAGVFQLLSEEAALRTARRELGTDRVVATDCTYNFLQAGRSGPFVARAQVVSADPAGVDLVVRATDEGNDGRLCCYSVVRVSPVRDEPPRR